MISGPVGQELELNIGVEKEGEEDESIV